MKKTERQGGAERRQGKAGGASAGEKRTNRVLHPKSWTLLGCFL